jgi:WD40 repeat protein
MRFATLSLFAALALAQDYATDIAPLLDKRCGGCHAGQAKMGEYSINTYESTLSGGNHGRTVIPGKPDESLLVQFVTGKAYPKMPMDGTSLTDGEVDLIRRWIAAGGKGKTVAARASVGAQVPAIQPKVTVKPQVFAMAWQPGGALLALAGHKSVTLTDAQTRKPVATLTPHTDTVRNVAFSSDGQWLAAAGGICAKSGEVRLWNVETRQAGPTINGHSDCIYGLAFAPDGKTLATSSYDKLIKIWDTATGREVRTLKDHIDAVYALQFTPDGSRLVSGAADRTVKIWNPATGERLYTFSEATDGINTLAIDPTGKLVAAGGLDKSIRIWRMGDINGELLLSLTAHEDAILKLAWSPDGKTLMSSSADRSVKLLRAADLTELKVLPGQSDWVYGLQFSPDGRQLAIARLDGSLALLPVAGTLSATR